MGAKEVGQLTADRALFLAADALGIPLFRKPGTHTVARGASPQTYDIAGFWSTSCDLVVESETLGAPSALFARFIGDLWAYLVVSPDQGAAWLYLFDGGVAKARVGDLGKVATGSPSSTIKTLVASGAIRGEYRYLPSTRSWEPANVA